MTATIQRPLRGSRISTFYPVKNLPSLASLDSAFQLQEYISLLIRLNVHDVNAIVSLPGHPSGKDKEKEVEVFNSSEKKDVDIVEKGKGEPTVDEACWIYEQLRRLAQDLSHPLITTLQQECTRLSCPEMKAGEWLYLCVAHGNDGAMEHCCAIDYILHTVDSATALLNSPRTFPSRLQIPVASHRHFSSLARRLGRIFAHAYFHHREAFEQAEAESSLYARFLALTERFHLVPAEFLVIPMDGPNIEPPSRSARDDHRRTNEFDRGYHQQQQQYQQEQEQRTRYGLDLSKFHHGPDPSSVQHQLYPNLTEERGSSPLGPSSPESGSGGIGESPSFSARVRFGRHRTGTMVFAEAEANAVTDELAARSSMREREQEHQKIELLDRDGDPIVAMPASLAHEGDGMQFEISLSPEEVIRGGDEGNGVPLEVFEERLGGTERHELPSLLDLNLELEAVGNMAAPSEPEANFSPESVSHPSTLSSQPVDEVTPASISDITTDQPKEEAPAPNEVKSDAGLEGQPIATETLSDIPLAGDSTSIPSIPKETPETATATVSIQEVATIPDASDDKETIPEVPTAEPAVSVAVDDISVEAPTLVEPHVETKLEESTETEPTKETSLDKAPSDKIEPVVHEPSIDGATISEEDKVEEKLLVVDSTTEGGATEEEKKT